jgi:hypothetical protein
MTSARNIRAWSWTTPATDEGYRRGVTELLAGSASGSTWILGKNAFDGFIRTGDDVGADDFSGFGSSSSTGIKRGLDCGDITGDDCVAKGAADLFHRSDEFNVCGFEHRVNADDETGEAAGFEESNCLFGHGSILFDVNGGK